MGMTITEKILAKHAGKRKVVPGDSIWAKINGVMMHDVTSDGAIKLQEKEFGDRDAKRMKIIVTPDHYVPSKDIKSAILYQNLKKWVEKKKGKRVDISDYMIEGGDYGVCHVMLPEKGHVLPGEIWVGGDSHTCTYGALGAFSTGLGTTEIGNTLVTGDMWFKVPESFKIEVNGRRPSNIMAKDIFLSVVGDIGVDGALYQAMEWTGNTIENMCMDERMTLTNMAIEAGAKSGIIAPDGTTIDYLEDHILGLNPHDFVKLIVGPSSKLCSDSDAYYSSVKKIDASGLEPLVAKPYLPSNVELASKLENVKIDQAYIGGCTGGKWRDFDAAAGVLRGNKVAKNVRLLVVPSTSDTQRRMVKEGLYDIFMDAGAVFSAPTCGACLGGYMGILAPGEVCISSTNRNFRGRMGHADSKVYLASPKTVAASAIAGHITSTKK